TRPAEARVGAADGVALGEEDGVRDAVGDAGRDLGDAAVLPVLVPAAAVDVPVGRVACHAAGLPVVAGGPAPAAGRHGRVAGGHVGLDRLAPVDPPGARLVPAGAEAGAGAAVDLRVLVGVVLLDERQQEVLGGAEVRRQVGRAPVRVIAVGEAPLAGRYLAVGVVAVVR